MHIRISELSGRFKTSRSNHNFKFFILLLHCVIHFEFAQFQAICCSALFFFFRSFVSAFVRIVWIRIFNQLNSWCLLFLSIWLLAIWQTLYLRLAESSRFINTINLLYRCVYPTHQFSFKLHNSEVASNLIKRKTKRQRTIWRRRDSIKLFIYSFCTSKWYGIFNLHDFSAAQLSFQKKQNTSSELNWRASRTTERNTGLPKSKLLHWSPILN